MDERHEDHEEACMKLREKTRSIDEEIKQVEENAAPASAFDELDGRFQAFSSIESITMLETVALPKMLGFTKLVNDLEDSHA